ncbi:MAG: cell division protein SepF [Candidatus Pacearchaeota archaeon]
MSFIEKIKDLLSKEKPSGEEYIEVDIARDIGKKAKIIIRPFVLKSFEDVNVILDVLREGYTIALIDIKQLRNKDVIELKRSIAKLKKTIDALEGSIAGFGENILIATPSFAKIYKAEPPKIEKIEKI